MNECWNYFRYAVLDELDEINDIIRSHKKWFSHLKDNHFHKKIIKKECIFESGVLITFHFTEKGEQLGDYIVPSGSTILEQIAVNKKSNKNDYVQHVFTKFINCSLGELYLAVNKRNLRAIKFYEKMNLNKISNAKLDYSKENGFIYKSNKKYN